MRSRGHSYQTRRFFNLSCLRINFNPFKVTILRRLEINHFNFDCQGTLSSVTQLCSVYYQMPTNFREACQQLPKLGTTSVMCLEPNRLVRHSKAVVARINCLPKIPSCFKFTFGRCPRCYFMMDVCLGIVTTFNSNLAGIAIFSLDCLKFQSQSLSLKGFHLRHFE